MDDICIHVIYVPKKFEKWDYIPENIRSECLRNLKGEIKYNEAFISLDSVLLDDPEKALREAWDEYIVKDGFFTCDIFGEYDPDLESYCCLVYGALTLVIIDLELYNISATICGDTNVIINIGAHNLKEDRTKLSEIFLK